MPIIIEPVASKSQVKQFVKLPFSIYRNDPNWVSQLLMDEYKRIDKKKHPFFLHAQAEFFIARRDGKTVGRIAAIQDALWKECHGENAAYWGWFESIDDPAVAQALFDAAHAWAKARGCTRIIGPLSPSDKDFVGLLVKGFEEPPCVLMPYNPPYYVRLIEGCGYRKFKDLLAWLVDDNTVPERLERIVPLIMKRGKFTIRTANMKDFDAELARARYVYNEFEKRNSIFTPITPEEFAYMGKDLKMAVDPNLVFFAEVDGKLAGLSLAVPDMNVALKPARGRLFPFGIIKILLATRKIKRLRVFSMGVLKEYRNRGIDSMFYYYTYKNAAKRGIESGEMSWVEEDNVEMNNTAKKMNAKPYKTYRIYEHAL
jgi:GNAT superfamily N-acetyltransferase